MYGGCLRSLTEECETSLFGGGRERILSKLNDKFPGASLRGRALCSAGDTGRATILTGRDLGEDDRQSRRCWGQARGEAGRARLHQQTLRTQIRPASVSRPRQHHLDPLLGWCTNYHGAQKGTLEPRQSVLTSTPLLHSRTQLIRERMEPLSLSLSPSPSIPFSRSSALSPLSRLCYNWCGLRYIFDFCFLIPMFPMLRLSVQY